MRKNVGDGDSVIRVMIGLVLLFAAAGVLNLVVVSMGLVFVAVLLLYTALTEWCPLYSLLGINTRANRPGKPGGAPGHQGG
ncbi:MAG TPA: DUF2892 domain-containing protein [Gemmatimonadales bacterium]|nr:DUF2892 domain-containing protein [Gemmatimonadales bacterium]